MAIGYDPFREFEQLTQQVLSGRRSPAAFPWTPTAGVTTTSSTSTFPALTPTRST
jgi:hypothetical protein